MTSLKGFIGTIIFGAAIGGATWYLTKKHYEDKCQDEIMLMREECQKKLDEFAERQEDEILKPPTEEAVDYASLAKTPNEQVNYNEIINNLNKATGKTKKSPNKLPDHEVIGPDMFVQRDDRNKVTLTYFEEPDIMVYAADAQKIEDYISLIGDNLAHMGEAEEGVLYVRNNLDKTDYEVVLSEEDYDDFVEAYAPY